MSNFIEFSRLFKNFQKKSKKVLTNESDSDIITERCGEQCERSLKIEQ